MRIALLRAFCLAIGILAVPLAHSAVPDHRIAAPAHPTGGASPDEPSCHAARRGLQTVGDGADHWPRSDCFTCHHNGEPMRTFAIARRTGALSDAEFRRLRDYETAEVKTEFDGADKTAALRAQTNPFFDPIDGSGDVAGVTSALGALQAAGYPADALTDAMVSYLLRTQQANGAWDHKVREARQPSEGNRFTATAQSVDGLEAYGAGRESAAAVAAALAKARRWLLQPEPAPISTEDKASRLRGLVTIGAPDEAIRRARTALLAAQNPEDGGWTRDTHAGRSDAYATAVALLALRQAGLGESDSRYRDARSFLVRAEARDPHSGSPLGIWMEPTQASPLQPLTLADGSHGIEPAAGLTRNSARFTRVRQADTFVRGLFPYDQDNARAGALMAFYRGSMDRLLADKQRVLAALASDQPFDEKSVAGIFDAAHAIPRIRAFLSSHPAAERRATFADYRAVQSQILTFHTTDLVTQALLPDCRKPR